MTELRKSDVPRIRLYTSSFCGYCDQARRLLERNGIEYEEIDVGGPGECCRLHELTGGASVPQAMVDGKPIGGYAELAALVRSSALADGDRRPEEQPD
jgi:glutaredoxin 3